jgi:alpha-methylacyl-CoA racemase
MLAALFEARGSGKGQVVDAAMVDGAALLMAPFNGMASIGRLAPRGGNTTDTGAHFYDAYECSDGEYISIGSIEPQFYAELRQYAGLDGELWDNQTDRSTWPERKAAIAAIFRTKTRAEWCEIMEGTDVCFAPVLDVTEAWEHPHNVERGTFTQVAGINQPRPAPRFSRTDGEVAGPPSYPGQHTDDVLKGAGFSDDEVAALRGSGAVR